MKKTEQFLLLICTICFVFYAVTLYVLKNKKEEIKSIDSTILTSSDITIGEAQINCDELAKEKGSLLNLVSKLRNENFLKSNKINLKDIKISATTSETTKKDFFIQEIKRDILSLGLDLKSISYARRIELFSVSTDFFIEANYNDNHKELSGFLKYETNLPKLIGN